MKVRTWLLQQSSKLFLTYHFLKFLRDLYFESKYLRYKKRYNIHPSFKFNGVDIEFYGLGTINIGENCYVGNRTVLAADKDCSIEIGCNCAISHNVRIYTSNRNPDDIINEKKTVSLIKGDVHIGHNVWIGANVFINQGVSIGNFCVIGANSVITKSIPNNSIVVGSNRIVKQIKK